MTKTSRPRRGSLAFSPRKRAKSETCNIRRAKLVEGKLLQGFAGYKAGMTHVIMVDDVPTSLTYGSEIAVPATVIETPPLRVEGIRLYKATVYGLRCLTEVLFRKTGEEGVQKIEDLLNGGNYELRLIMATQPHLVTGVPKKRPEIMELRLGGGSGEDAFDYAKNVFGKEVSIKDVFSNGDFVDVTAVTKGKGTQGPVKRWGVKIQNAKAYRSSKGRHIGTLGPWTPARTSWRVPMMGQTGYHQRTEYNKRILKVGENGEEVTPKGGFLHYGIVRNEYVLLKGSVPGPAKRLVRLSPAVRGHFKLTAPQIVRVSTESKQGC
ncbi:50S ribosomal protein L3 [Candidatus Alkanophaga liquidiphilum]|nr:Ribosomal protein L3 [Candidatus Alkanophaga liquidiphilum]